MTTLLYSWPVAARFGRAVPKTKFYEHATIGAGVRDKFVSEVRRITWAYKLAESTINLSSSAEVPEIQVFEIDGKVDHVSEEVLAAIDKAVRTPIIFEIRRSQGAREEIQMVAAHKQLGNGAPKVGPYFRTEWHPAETKRAVLPTAIDLTALYTALVQPLTPLESQAGEKVSDVVARLTTVRKIEREITALERKLRNEPQLNRKVELRRTLRAKQTALAKLTSTATGPTAGNTN
ncbi:DUF4391 domain-containing protein [Dietzia kunjamensis]|uniref:DUF4391 domain-containing protein n=1 Tax=Dietzia kunjamensis TaxID=322509 RepID=UPI0022B41FEB|nr:DUF4391 domain-containing protein [Dietzia kunjamensis]MCZ4657040.1 DUF4391 domain-containing protein [Dietzia kunjamensis]